MSLKHYAGKCGTAITLTTVMTAARIDWNVPYGIYCSDSFPYLNLVSVLYCPMKYLNLLQASVSMGLMEECGTEMLGNLLSVTPQ